MIDTNQIAHALDQATAVKSQLSPYVPALVVAAGWLGRELTRFNDWAAAAAAKIMAHGGLGKIIIKLFWN
ncbi:MAG TPA: hypothetical protein VGO57_02235 [Verrucomicrobiae bacterium]|jgi:hypothetical protein